MAVGQEDAQFKARLGDFFLELGKPLQDLRNRLLTCRQITSAETGGAIDYGSLSPYDLLLAAYGLAPYQAGGTQVYDLIIDWTQLLFPDESDDNTSRLLKIHENIPGWPLLAGDEGKRLLAAMVRAYNNGDIKSGRQSVLNEDGGNNSLAFAPHVFDLDSLPAKLAELINATETIFPARVAYTVDEMKNIKLSPETTLAGLIAHGFIRYENAETGRFPVHVPNGSALTSSTQIPLFLALKATTNLTDFLGEGVIGQT